MFSTRSHFYPTPPHPTHPTYKQTTLTSNPLPLLKPIDLIAVAPRAKIDYNRLWAPASWADFGNLWTQGNECIREEGPTDPAQLDSHHFRLVKKKSP